MTLNQFINDHLVINIGHAMSGYAFTDVIVNNPVELIEFVDCSTYFISGVLWWEKVLNDRSPQLGAGGIADPRDPGNIWYAETFLSCEFDRDTNKQDYLQYLDSVVRKYPEITLLPSFDIAYR